MAHARLHTRLSAGRWVRHRRPPLGCPVRVLLAVFTVVAALSLVQKVPCMQTHWTNNEVRYSKMCYSDIPYLYLPRGMAEQSWPYSDTGGRYQVMEYPVGISYFAWGTSLLTKLFASGPSPQVRAATPADPARGA